MNTVINSADLANPFPGLRPFKPGEEHFFFGREKQTDALVDKLEDTRFLAVIGSSGSGKSSLVNCGLMTALHSGLMSDAGTTWRIAQCRPSGHPVRSLASALAEPDVLFNDFDHESVNLADVIDSTLHMSERGIVDIFEQARLKPNVNLLIVIDQFEELFRYTDVKDAQVQTSTKARREAAEFIKLLLFAQKQTERPIYILITMRSDFLGDCTRFEGLAEAINAGQYLVPRMTRRERRLAISGPVAVGGARMDSVLLTKLVNDLGDDPDQLSVLQHALNRIWDRWSSLGRPDDPLNRAHYSAIGDMQLALDYHAEEAYGELTTERQQLLCEKLFKALTDKATDHRGVRRPTSLATLCDLTGATTEELIPVIDTFRKPSRSFLMPPTSQPLEPETIIDISHESLMRMWKRLVNWADDEAESSTMYLRLAGAAALHANAQAGLWRDPELQLALTWRDRTRPNEQWASQIGPGFNQAMKFLDDSRVASEDEAARIEALQLAEQEMALERSKAAAQALQLEAQATAAKRLRLIVWIISGAVIVAGGLLIHSLRQNTQLHEQRNGLLDSQKSLARVVNNLTTVATNRTNELTATLATVSNMADRTKPVNYEFRNESGVELSLQKLGEDGAYSDPTVLSPGESTSISGVTNQLWIARAINPDNPEAIHNVGSFQENNSVVVLD